MLQRLIITNIKKKVLRTNLLIIDLWWRNLDPIKWNNFSYKKLWNDFPGINLLQNTIPTMIWLDRSNTLFHIHQEVGRENFAKLSNSFVKKNLINAKNHELLIHWDSTKASKQKFILNTVLHIHRQFSNFPFFST